MSKDATDSALRGMDAFNRGETDAFIEFLASEAHPDFFFHIQEDIPNGGVWEGTEGTRTMLNLWMEAWDEFEVIPGEPVEGADGRVLIPVQQRAVLAGSEMELKSDFQYVWVMEDGKVREVHLFSDPDQASRTAGIGD